MRRACLALSLALAAWLYHGCVQVAASKLVTAEEPTWSRSVDVSNCPNLKIALINGVSFHFEIVAGLLHVLKPYEKYVDVYMSPWIRKENYDGEACMLCPCALGDGLVKTPCWADPAIHKSSPEPIFMHSWQHFVR